MVPPRLRFALLAAAFVVLPPARARAEEPRPSAAAEEAVRALGSPLLAERSAAVARLIDLLPGSRPAVVAALERATPAERLLLVEVLARDGSAEGVRPLLGVLSKAEPPLVARISLLLATNPAARKTLSSLRAAGDPATAPSPWMEDLERLLLRSEVERLFLSRKSTTGYTGYFRGQYEALAADAYRDLALEMCLRILEDRAMPVPGTHSAGRFEFLSPPSAVEFDEVQSMAGHAITELVRGEDDRQRVIMRLDRLKEEVDRERRDLQSRFHWDRENDPLERALREKNDFYIDIVCTMYRVDPELFEGAIDRLLEDIEDYTILVFSVAETRAAVLLLVGRYPEAIGAYQTLLRTAAADSRNYANTHYNIACAYASWSLEPGEVDPARLRTEAIRNLSLAVEKGRWSDIGWMEQDRDLDPIRDLPEYRRLVERIRRDNTPPGMR